MTGELGPGERGTGDLGTGDFEPWITRWRLRPDGAPFATPWGSRLMPVRLGARAAMLKIAGSEEERNGARLMAWWEGEGAARVFEIDETAILLERAEGPLSLAAMARGGEDDEATRILCRAAARLHQARAAAPPATLVPLPVWFRALAPAAERWGGVLALSARAARALLASPHDARPLHGDLHHGNVLDGGARGWLAIDPKGLIGERGFDYANIVCTPDIETAAAPGALARRAAIITAQSGLELERTLTWVLAYAGLSASWTLGDGGDAEPALRMARLAAGELGLA